MVDDHNVLISAYSVNQLWHERFEGDLTLANEIGQVPGLAHGKAAQNIFREVAYVDPDVRPSWDVHHLRRVITEMGRVGNRYSIGSGWDTGMACVHWGSPTRLQTEAFKHAIDGDFAGDGFLRLNVAVDIKIHRSSSGQGSHCGLHP